MLRSLIATIAATIVGLAAAKFVEGAGTAGLALDAPNREEPASLAYHILLVAGWGIGAFAAAATALLIGRRWAPLGWLAAATIFFAAVMTAMTHALSWLLWPGSAAATALGGLAAVRLLRAPNAPPAKGRERSLFGE